MWLATEAEREEGPYLQLWAVMPGVKPKVVLAILPREALLPQVGKRHGEMASETQIASETDTKRLGDPTRAQ